MCKRACLGSLYSLAFFCVMWCTAHMLGQHLQASTASVLGQHPAAVTTIACIAAAGSEHVLVLLTAMANLADCWLWKQSGWLLPVDMLVSTVLSEHITARPAVYQYRFVLTALNGDLNHQRCICCVQGTRTETARSHMRSGADRGSGALHPKCTMRITDVFQDFEGVNIITALN